jgi:hexokinase
MNESTLAQVKDLLRANGMAPEVLDLGTLSQLFLSQMRIALYGGKSSIPVLPTFLKPFGELKEGEPIAVAELDDRNVTVSLVTFSQGQAQVTERDSFPIPGREYPAPFQDVIYAVAELLEPLLPQAKGIALCLPFPVDYDGKGDGAIRQFPGNMQVSDFQGQPVLAALSQELSDRDLPALPAVLVNQSDAALLGAGVVSPGQSRYLGLAWGQTIGAGFVAPGSIVLRWPAIQGDLMLFDGGFSTADCVPFGMSDFPKDRDCYGPGLDLYHKIVSTDYLGDTFRLVMIKAAERKLLSFGCSRDILSLTTLDLASVIAFLDDPIGGGTIAHFCREPEDREVGLVVAEAVLDRAASLVCANLTALLQFIGAGRDPEHPVCIGAWGEALAIPALRAALEEHLRSYTRDILGLHCILQPVDDLAPGAAAAALYQQK